MDLMTVASAFAGGLLSFFSPCVFPLLPGYISMISGVSAAEAASGGNSTAKAGVASLCFVAGFSAVFALLGASASAIASFLTGNTRLLSGVAGALLVFFGLQSLGVFRLKFLQYEKRFSPANIKPSRLGAFMMGAAFALGWSPCIGPILAGFLSMAAMQGTAAKGCLLLLVYSLGMGLPFIVAGFAVGRLIAMMARYRKLVRYTEMVAGALLLLIGAGLLLSSRPGPLGNLLP